MTDDDITIIKALARATLTEEEAYYLTGLNSCDLIVDHEVTLEMAEGIQLWANHECQRHRMQNLGFPHAARGDLYRDHDLATGNLRRVDQFRDEDF